ncbi:arsenical resistance operon transcriptional repressor ArsD [Bremerella cremea]|uniref:Arsenical resistance operon transcriptional repressor ArsD n=1 Tax=Bremerella cremea TaxID=1031537 RepID=A0A368KQB3_9BACT|nr:arsenite efflux transporter metallochaperone ArsD [Bremerella cremea]RCS48227.1 arsenical resistance operon transcriptional repressor ArsD [Bremerella cremea]
MSHVQVFDKPMCCSTGVCGPQVDPVLPQFAADLDWLKSQGHQVDRFNLAQQPEAFAQNADVQQILAAQGVECLPLVMIDGQQVSAGEYPSREKLTEWTGTVKKTTSLPLSSSGGCCGGGGGGCCE